MRARAQWLLMPMLLVSLILPARVSAKENDGEKAADLAKGELVDAEKQEPLDLEKMERERKLRRSLNSLRERVGRYQTAAVEVADEESPEEGLALLRKLDPTRLNPYERALVYRLMGYLSYQAADFPGAIDYFGKVLQEEILPIKEDDKIRFAIAQLYAAQQKWRESIAALHRWFQYVKDPDPLAYYLLGIAHYQLEEPDQAIGYTEKAVDLAPAPKQSWLQLLAALYVQKEDYQSAAPVLEELVLRFPKKEYWVQLSLIYGAQDEYGRSLAVQQVAYAQGLLTEDKELRRLARSYLYHELPYPAARILEKGLREGAIEPDADAYELLANSWIQAREFDRSLEPLQKAAELSEDGDLYVRLGQVRMQREEWHKAVELFKKAIAKGDLKNPGNAQLLLGIAYYNDSSPGRARSSFVLARQHAKTREEADRWLEHMQKESRQQG